MALFVLSLRYFLQQNKENEDVIFAGEHWKFEIFVEDFDRKVQEIPTNFNSIYDFWYFCSNLHNSIDWKIKHWDSEIFTNFLSCLLKPDKEYNNLKKAFAGFCKKFRLEFLLLSGLSKDNTIF